MLVQCCWFVVVCWVVVLDWVWLGWIIVMVVDYMEVQLVYDIVQCFDVDFFYFVGVFQGFVGVVEFGVQFVLLFVVQFDLFGDFGQVWYQYQLGELFVVYQLYL